MEPQNQYPAQPNTTPPNPPSPQSIPVSGASSPQPTPTPSQPLSQPQPIAQPVSQPQPVVSAVSSADITPPAATPPTPTTSLSSPNQLSEPHVSPPSKRETLREVISTIGVLVAALVVAFSLIAWVFQSYEVEGPSMMNTLQNHDRLIVWKVPRTIARITNNDFIPRRGDIIIFVEGGLSQYGQADSKQLIKRVIALPGERVVLEDGKLTVYNKEHPEGFQPDKLGGYKIIAEPSDVHSIDITLSENQIFVCGDNRPDSLDSRTFGPITADQIVGKLSLRLLPVSEIQKFD